MCWISPVVWNYVVQPPITIILACLLKNIVAYSHEELCGYFFVFDIFYGKNRQKVVYYFYIR